MISERFMSSVQFSSVWTFIFAHSYRKSYHERGMLSWRHRLHWTVLNSSSIYQPARTLYHWLQGSLLFGHNVHETSLWEQQWPVQQITDLISRNAVNLFSSLITYGVMYRGYQLFTKTNGSLAFLWSGAHFPAAVDLRRPILSNIICKLVFIS